MWCCIIECVSTNILKAILSLKCWEPHTPWHSKGLASIISVTWKTAEVPVTLTRPLKSLHNPIVCSRDTDKDDTLYCESLFKFSLSCILKSHDHSVWRYIMRLFLIKYLACSNWHIRHSKGVISSSIKQKADEEVEDPTADKWLLCPTWHNTTECLDKYSHFVHRTSDSPEDILKWCRIYRCTLTVFLKKVPNK